MLRSSVAVALPVSPTPLGATSWPQETTTVISYVYTALGPVSQGRIRGPGWEAGSARGGADVVRD